MKPFRKICVWKKAVSFLGSLPVALQHEDWKLEYMGNHYKNEEGDGQWHAEIRLTDPYGNVYDQDKTSLNTKESDSDDEEDYKIQRNKFGAPVYGLKPTKYLNCHDPLDRSIALQEVMKPFRKICVWKKAVSFLGSLPVALQHEDWKLEYMGNHCKNEEGDGQWHAEIRLTDPYGNVYDQGFVTKKTNKRLSMYHKLSDIMSPN
ncbi:hypothetical protein Tco_1161625 [Tanacetum coccineum]